MYWSDYFTLQYLTTKLMGLNSSLDYSVHLIYWTSYWPFTLNQIDFSVHNINFVQQKSSCLYFIAITLVQYLLIDEHLMRFNRKAWNCYHKFCRGFFFAETTNIKTCSIWQWRHFSKFNHNFHNFNHILLTFFLLKIIGLWLIS